MLADVDFEIQEKIHLCNNPAFCYIFSLKLNKYIDYSIFLPIIHLNELPFQIF